MILPGAAVAARLWAALTITISIHDLARTRLTGPGPDHSVALDLLHHGSAVEGVPMRDPETIRTIATGMTISWVTGWLMGLFVGGSRHRPRPGKLSIETTVRSTPTKPQFPPPRIIREDFLP